MYNKLKSIIIIIIFFIFQSCIKESSSRTNLKLRNSTSHSIMFKSYKNGYEVPEKSFLLSANEFKIIESQRIMGKSKRPVVNGEFFLGLDSIIIQWDNIYSVVHLNEGITTTSKNISYNDTQRNLFRISSYNEILIENLKRYAMWDLEYNFDNTDYEYAKE